MVVNHLLRNAPVVGSVYGFTKTAMKVYNCKTPSGAVLTSAKGIVIDCTPPIIKYPLLCGAMAACGAAAITTGNLLQLQQESVFLNVPQVINWEVVECRSLAPSTFNSMKEAIKKEGTFKYRMLDEVLGEFEEEVLIELLDSTYKIHQNEQVIYFVNEDGDRVNCPNFGASMQNDGKWLSDIIPDVSFDVEQDGNLRRAKEAESAYILAIFGIVLGKNFIGDDFFKTIKNYDYVNCIAKAFQEILDEIISLQSYTVNVIISAAKFRIADLKKYTVKFLRSGIPLDLVTELRSKIIVVNDINRRYSSISRERSE